MKNVIIPVIAMSMLLAGCVTKPMGREEALTDTERGSMTCQGINVDLARSHAFTQRIVNDPTDARDVSGFMLDWGIGNHMEKSDALKSVAAREKQLEDLRAAKNCPLSTVAVQSAN